MKKARRIASMILVFNIVAGIARCLGKWHLLLVLVNAVAVLILAVMELEKLEDKKEEEEQ